MFDHIKSHVYVVADDFSINSISYQSVNMTRAESQTTGYL